MENEFNMLAAGVYITLLECYIGRICVAQHAKSLGISCHDFINQFGKPKDFEVVDKNCFFIKYRQKAVNYQFKEDGSVLIDEEIYDDGIQQKKDRRNLN